MNEFQKINYHLSYVMDQPQLDKIICLNCGEYYDHENVNDRAIHFINKWYPAVNGFKCDSNSSPLMNWLKKV